MTISSTAFPAHGLTLVHDLDAQPNPRCYVLFLHGRDTVIEAEANETPDELWGVVLGVLAQKRLGLALNKGLLDPQAPATVYAGHLEDASLERLRLKHMKAFIVEGLTRESSGSLKDSTGTSRTNALCALSRILGLEKPRKRVVTRVALTTPPTDA